MKKQRREHFIIDGYNVINAWSELIALRDNLGYARDRLIHIMAEYGAYEDYDVTIVFDALFTETEKTCEKINEQLKIVYTDEHETADSYIEKLAYDLVRMGKEVHVVTSDGAEQSLILGAGAYRMPSLELQKLVKKAKKAIAEEYTGRHIVPLNRHELGARIDSKMAEQLDKIRKNKR
jgi:uncharacterized protein